MPVLCLGEILFDCAGDVRLPGGAPANVACHLAALGETVMLASRVGDDADGRQLRSWLTERKIGVDLLQVDRGCSTGAVRVLPGPRYEIAEPAAWDFIARTDASSAAAEKAGAVIFGTLAQRQPVSRKTIRALVGAARSAGVPVLCDLNLRAPFFDEETVLWSLRHCDVLKLNREELELVSAMLSARGESRDLLAGLLREFGIARGVLTTGKDGAWLCEDGEFFHQPAEEVSRFVDAVGAGDGFTAVLAAALARGLPLRAALPPAAALAAFVVSRLGAAPEIPGKLAARINAMLGV